MRKTKDQPTKERNPKDPGYKMKAIKLEENGKVYYPVHERIKKLNQDGHDYELQTHYQILTDRVVISASLIVHRFDQSAIPLTRTFMGTAIFPLKDDKAIQKAETIAWGRACAAFGIGISDAIASADEIEGIHDKQKELIGALTGTTAGTTAGIAIGAQSIKDELDRVIKKKKERIPKASNTNPENLPVS